MLHRGIALTLTGLVVLVALGVGPVFSQDTGGGPGGDRRWSFDPNMFRAFDPNTFRKAASDRMRQSLGATEEEWTVLEPKIEKVQTLSMQARGGMMMGMGMMGMGGRGGEPTDMMKASQALTKVLQNKDAAASEIKTALQVLRDAKAKAKAELEQAQKELKEVLSVRQEALLVQMGLLE